MRTTVNIDDGVLEEAKLVAARSGRTLGEVISDALRRQLFGQGSTSRNKPIELHTVAGQGLCAGVDLDDNAALLELMEKSGASD